MSAATFHHGQTKSPAQASLFKRLGRLFHLPVIPLFVFDGPHRPTYKRKKIVKKMPIWLTNDFKRLLEGFGFSYWDAPGEAEAELAMLSCLGRIDAVMSEDFDTMLFGAQQVIRIKEESDSKYLIEVHEAGSQFSCNNLVMIALLTGGDYDDGIQGCGVQTAANIAKSSVGERLFDALEASEVDDYAAVASAWHRDLCTALEKQGAGRLHSRQCSLASRIPLDFPKVSVLIQYIHPVTSQSNGVGNLPAAPSLRQPDISQLAKLCEELFVWGHSMGIIRNFRDHVFPGLATHDLLQDLCKQQGLLKDDDTHISQHAIVSKVRAVRANQCE
ncbi:PIN domain-like protein [Desarmillaria tabescens]|uniref:PIN domain-like protein n=1 Tax=Armillaria tabescens TaxID=1929756 RepID=A0AA39KAF3_ARMTA|nr:PIN domain-like protein [Desarmillaria tabescens]KAK0457551.1 PIN domain-like protein [Desarmillaria tabescens]